MKKYKVVITDYEFEDLRYEKLILSNPRLDVQFYQCKTEDELIEVCKDADGVICQYARITENVINHLEKCQIICRYGIGVDNIDLEAATRKNIAVSNAPDYGIEEVSNHALALIMDAARKITLANQYTKKGEWNYQYSKPLFRLNGRIVGLVGFGNIPQKLALKLKPLGVDIVVYDPYVSDEVIEMYGVKRVTLEELCRTSFIISLHLPLTTQTKGIINKLMFSLMNKGTILINTSRGPVVKEADLIQALHDGIISVAGLDVIETEPLEQNHPFLKMENVILTPHVAWYSEEAAIEVRCKTSLGIVDVLLYNEYPKYLVNRVLIEKSSLSKFKDDGRYVFDKSKIDSIFIETKQYV